MPVKTAGGLFRAAQLPTTLGFGYTQRIMRAAALSITALTILASSSLARADITHVVQRGHTIEAIAHRYHVTVKAILEANHLTDPKNLRPGQSLVIPGVDPPSKKKDGKHEGTEKSTPGSRAATESLGRMPERSARYEPSPEPRGRGERDDIHAIRLGEEFRIRAKDAHGHIPTSALKAFERMMRQGNATHTVDPRLVALVGIVSDHFAGRTIEVVSGYRAYSPTQYTPHSNHNFGKALDFRIRGVQNEALRDFCRTLRSAGCGYYPNSTFVHLDVRDTKAYWVDWSHPGEPPKYDRPGVAADEGAGDVPDEGPAPTTPAASAAPSATPSAPPPSVAAPAPAAPSHDGSGPAGTRESPEPHPMAPPDSPSN
jgi:uncharacterized protein YcbK (DUF882 family)